MATDRDVLPTSVRPTNYNLSVHDIELGGAWSYKGLVKIDVEVREETKDVVLNTHLLKILSAEFQAAQGKTENSIKTDKISYDEKNQRATLHFDQPLSQSKKAVISIAFQGTINNDMAGFYRSKYKPTGEVAASVPQVGEFHYMFSTQFESSDARRAFPCFDEPNLKASFELSIEIPEDQTALSNMPESGTTKSSKPGLKVVSFEKSPVMSTYLFAWAFADFEYVEEFTKRKYNGKHLPVRVYATRGLIHQGKLALDAAHQIVDYFSEIFKVDYPLPKVDLVAVHEFSHGAMENWGLITYRTTAVLYDPEKSDERFKNRITYVVAHELAHQWFGDLVTMDWWNELWLNEGFATWVGWYAVDHLHPDWNVWAQSVTEGMQTAFTLDSLRTSHPIEVPVRNALDVDQIFDAISYEKGSSVIRMLAAFLTPEVFLDGVGNYLMVHKFGNATTSDLWDSLSEFSGQDVNGLMETWIKKIGFPVVTVAEEPGQISVRQSRFLSSGDVKAEEDTTTWWVPLGLQSGAGSQVKTVVLESKEDTIRNIDDGFYKLNKDNAGFYRVNLPPQRLTQLAGQLQHLSVEDRIGLISDAGALAASGDATTAGVLSFLEGFSHEKDTLVWSEIVATLGNIRSVFSDDAQVSEGLRKFALKLLTPAVEEVGWEFAPSDNYLTGRKRALLLLSAGGAGHKGTIAEAQKRFKAYVDGNKKAIHPSLRLAVFSIAIQHGGRAEYEAVQHAYKTADSIDGKEIALLSMGRVQTPELAADLLKWAFSGAVALQDLHWPTSSLATNSKARLSVWEFFKNEWESTILKALGGNSAVVERFVRVSLAKFANFDVEREIEQFYKDKDNRAYDRALAVSLASITSRASYRERDGGVIREWLGAHGYAS